MSKVIQALEQRQLRKDLPQFKAGDTLKVHFRVIEGSRSRIQVFEGLVIKRQGAGSRETFTARKQSFGVGVERTFPLHSPKIEKIEVIQIGDVNRAKLYYLRKKVGKKARVRAKQYGGSVSSLGAPEAVGEEDLEDVEPDIRRRSRARGRSRARAPKPSSSPTAEAEQPSTSRDDRPTSRPPTSRRTRKRTGQRLLRFDRRLGARWVAGADEAGRGSLAGPLVVAGVLLDYAALRDHRVRPLAYLNDSKQLYAHEREELYRAVLSCAQRVSVRVITHVEIDRTGLHACNLAGLRDVLHALAPPAEACLVDGFRLGPRAPEHLAVVDGDTKSAAIAAASIVAKVVRDRAMRRLDAVFPQYEFSSHVGYITPRHSAQVRSHGPSAIHRRSFDALCYSPEIDEAA